MAAPLPGSVPMLTRTMVLPALPAVTVPCEVCTEPTTRVVFGSRLSPRTTPVAAWLPSLRTSTVYRNVSPGDGCPSLSASTNSE